MNNTPRKRLCKLIDEQGADIYQDKKRCKAFLLDYCGEYQREIFVLTKAIEQDIPEELEEHNQDPKMPLQALVTCLKNRLQDCYALTEGAALWAVKSWALALSVATDREAIEVSQEGAKKKKEMDPRTFYDLVNKYYYGRGINENHQEAIKWYQRASEISLQGRLSSPENELANSLFFSVLVGKVELVKNLLQSGVDVNAQDKEGRTPLIYSILANQQLVAEELINAGADLEIIDNTGHSALHWAIMLGEIEIVKLLIEAGADIYQTNKAGNQAWEIADNYRQQEIKGLILGVKD